MNVFFDVDGTIVGTWDGRLRPLVREVFDQLRRDGHALYVWSGVGLRWMEIEEHGLRPFIETCFHKPTYDHHAQLAPLGVTVRPEFVIDDHPQVVAAFGGVTVRPFYTYDAADREMERVYQVITGDDLPFHTNSASRIIKGNEAPGGGDDAATDQTPVHG